ncbi:MAG: hypothetical protein E7505_03795 [Ruminococcus sp.]|nr:hypothetical protein [Ruminococcus sp.]
MILRMPEYCRDFRCTAEKCKDNCCIGWEIDIDEKSYEFYMNTEGEFGKKLRENISGNTPAVFKLCDDERCPFLNNKNLCEIFINLGEDKLCDICTEHPRYYEWFSQIKEGGIGLGCEESARIILSQDKRFSYDETVIEDESCDEYDNDLYICLEKARGMMIEYLQDRKYPILNRISDVLFFSHRLQENTDNGIFEIPEISHKNDALKPDIKKLLNFFCSLEVLDKNRVPYLKKCEQCFDKVCAIEEEFSEKHPEKEKYLENIAVYFIWRYFLKGVFDGEFFSRVFLMWVSCTVIDYLAGCIYAEKGSISSDDFLMVAKDYSKETEYCEENIERILDEAYNSDWWESEF